MKLISEFSVGSFLLSRSMEVLRDAAVAHVDLTGGSAYVVSGVLVASSGAYELLLGRSKFCGYAIGQSYGFRPV